MNWRHAKSSRPSWVMAPRKSLPSQKWCNASCACPNRLRRMPRMRWRWPSPMRRKTDVTTSARPREYEKGRSQRPQIQGSKSSVHRPGCRAAATAGSGLGIHSTTSSVHHLTFMITFLHGKLVETLPTQVVMDVQGVGYEVLIPLSSYDRHPQPGQEVKVLTHLVVRDD